MAHVIVMGAGIGGLPMAYELREMLAANDRITVIGLGATFQFVPSNPWLAVDWRERDDVEFPIAPYLERRNIAYDPRGVKRVHPAENRVELRDGTRVRYMHLLRTMGLEVGAGVRQGQIIALAGHSGRTPHDRLRLELWQEVDGELTTVDPMRILAKGSARAPRVGEPVPAEQQKRYEEDVAPRRRALRVAHR